MTELTELDQLDIEVAMDGLGQTLAAKGFSAAEVTARLIIEAERVGREMEVNQS